MSSIHRSPNLRSSPPTRRLSTTECRDWLISHCEGRLGYPTGRGPRSVVVNYAVAGEHIMFRLPDYNDIVHYAPGERVTLEVDGAQVDGEAAFGDFETVVVTGEARLTTSHQEPEVVDHHSPEQPSPEQLSPEQRQSRGPWGFREQWPVGVATSVICLPMTEVEGFERDVKKSLAPRG